MLDFLNDNSGLINAVASFGMLVVWAVYLQVFLANLRRQTRPKIVINRAAGSDLEASCFVSNMGSSAIYVESIIVTVGAGDEDSWTCPVTDLEADGSDMRVTQPGSYTHQGTLSSGQYMQVETFATLVDRVLQKASNTSRRELDKNRDQMSVNIHVIADQAGEEDLIGAERQFNINRENGNWRIRPASPTTRQVRSRPERRQMRDTLAEID